MTPHRPDATPTDAPIANRASYIGYKHNTRDFVRWMVKTTIFAMRSRSTDEGEASLPSDIKTTGKFKIADLLSMASFIAKTQVTVSGHIYRLVLSIVRARTTHYEAFKLHVSVFPDPAIERSNATHLYFIDSMLRIFSILGGNVWLAQQMQATQLRARGQQASDINEVKEFIFSNKFDSLNVELCDDQSDSESDTEPAASSKQQKNRKKKGGKGKKSKTAGKKYSKRDDSTSEIDDVSLDHYRILEDDEDLMMRYTIAACAFKSEWTQIRAYVQRMWHDVAFDGLNAATAGATSNLAIAKIKHTELEMFVDFPDNDSYETIIQALTRNDPDGFQSLAEKQAANGTEDCASGQLDTSEQLLIYAYHDLVDFVSDFQKNRSGKPTKFMQAKLGIWDPKFCLRDATKQQRLKWRRTFTINWLYDLVNVYTRHAQKALGTRCLDGSVDVSADGHWGVFRNLFGLHDFAAFVTSLAILKPGSSFRHKILPHHVFLLQCVVDATMIYHGWSICEQGSHNLQLPASEFSPRDDVDEFLDTNGRGGLGYMRSTEVLKDILRIHSESCGDGSVYAHPIDMLQFAEAYLGSCLGSSGFDFGLMMAPSRFSQTNMNGLWDYSPFLCGVGLVEALQVAFNTMMEVWDSMPEPVMLMHLYNMLAKEGYIPSRMPMYTTIHRLFSDAFYAGGEVPVSDYAEASKALVHTIPKRLRKRRTAMAQSDFIKLIGRSRGKHNMLYNMTAQLTLYQDAGWNPSRIPDSLLHPGAALKAVRQGKVGNNATSIDEKRLENFVRQYKCKTQVFDRPKLPDAAPLQVQDVTADCCSDNEDAVDNQQTGFGIWRSETILGDLDVAMIDFGNDINGEYAYTGIDYAMVTIDFIWLLVEIETDLSKMRHPIFTEIYENPRIPNIIMKRCQLVQTALRSHDKEFLTVVAKCFSKREAPGACPRITWPYYWRKMEKPIDRQAKLLMEHMPTQRDRSTVPADVYT